MQIKVECFGVAYGAKVKNIIETQSGKKKLKEENNYQKQECLATTKDMVSRQSSEISNWKAPGVDWVQCFCIRKLTKLNERTAFLLNKI